jgi:tRNA U34 5-methylaminomethyl-2-thiouridine-forming methyltransferase MnmC
MTSRDPEDDRFALVTLRNGARAVQHLGHGEVMHPSVGPWREANALYVEQTRLAERLAAPTSGPLRIYDVGLGAAANAAAAILAARQAREAGRARRPLEVISFERSLQPLELALKDAEGFPFLVTLNEAIEAILTSGRWAEDGIDWQLILGALPETYARATRPAELIFFDPFSPSVTPELWTPGALRPLFEAALPDESLLVTYSAATPTRVSLLLAGFFVGAGAPIGGKRETTVASKRLEALERPLDARWLQRWTRSPNRAPHGGALTSEHERLIYEHSQFAR